MRTHLYLDLETRTCNEPALLRSLRDDIQAPANYKDPDKISKYIIDKFQEKVGSTALDGNRGSIAVIGWKIDGQIPMVFDAEDRTEKELLSLFVDELREHVECVWTDLIWTGWNIPWDVSFLRRRLMIQGVSALDAGLPMLPRALTPWDSSLCDVMGMWMAPSKDRCKLSDAAQAIGIPCKEGMTGAEVPEALDRGEWGKVREYCLEDVLAVEQIHKRILSLQGEINPLGEEVPF